MASITPSYDVITWPEDGHWCARVYDTGSYTDQTPLDHTTQADSFGEVESAVRAMIASVLKVAEDDFDVEIQVGASDVGF